MSTVHRLLTLRQARATFKPAYMERQFRYAARRTVNNFAFDSVPLLKADLLRKFAVKNPRYTLGSIRARQAKKNKAGPIVASVGSVSRYLAIHVTGGQRDRKSAQLQSVPTKHVRETPYTKTTVGKWPSRYLRRAKRYHDRWEKGKKTRSPKPMPFLLRRKGKTPLLAMRTARAHGSPLKVLYLFPTHVTIRKRWDPMKVVHFHVWETLNYTFRHNADRALATMKIRE